MCRDTNEELKRLDEALQEESLPAPAEKEVRVYNTDKTDEDLEEFSKTIMTEEKKSLTGLAVTVIVLLAAILGVIAFWMARYRGLFL